MIIENKKPDMMIDEIVNHIQGTMGLEGQGLTPEQLESLRIDVKEQYDARYPQK